MTIREIANITGLSTATVHRALRKPENSKPEIIKQINTILEQNIVENIGLKKIYIILPHINEFYTKLIVDLITIFNKYSIQIVPFITHEDKKSEYNFISSIPFSSKIGLIWVPTDTEHAYSFLNRQKNKPVVIFFNRKLTAQTPHAGVFLDNHGAVAIAVEELVKNQHSKLLFINGDLNLQTAITREQGFLAAIQKYSGIESKIINANFHEWRSAYQSIIEHKDIITNYDAIISGNELLTYGILKGLKELQLSIPKDICFIGIDNSFSIESQDLSTIYFSTQQISDQIARIFLDHTHNLQTNSIYYITARLSLRGSEKKVLS